jgi:hypothetical protein
MDVYFTGMHLMGVYLINVYLTDVHLMSVHLTGLHLMGVCLTGLHFMGVQPGSIRGRNFGTQLRPGATSGSGFPRPAGLIVENPPLTSLSPIRMHVCEMRAREMQAYGDACLGDACL